MPASQKANQEMRSNGCLNQKSVYLRDLKLLLKEEGAAIEALDMEKLHAVINEMEAVLSELESLDRQENVGENKQLAERERALIIESLSALSEVGDKNLKRLLEKKEETLAQLKELRSKKAARKAYHRTQMMK